MFILTSKILVITSFKFLASFTVIIAIKINNVIMITVNIIINNFQDSIALEEEYSELRQEVLQKLNQSEQDYEAVLDIENRTLTVLQLTQQQILDVESKMFNI